MSIEDNVAAGTAANDLFDLAMEEALRFQNDAALRFWTVILKQVLNVVPERYHPKRIVQQPVVPMTRDECVVFGMEFIQFGKHHGERIDCIPLPYLEWLDSQPDFRRQLARYLASPTVRSEMSVTEENDEHEL